MVRSQGRSYNLIWRFGLALSCMLGIAGPGIAQLGTWLARDLNGVYLLDVSTPTPTTGAFIPGLGTSGQEDVNVMTDASNNLLFCTAVDNTNAILEPRELRG